MDRELWTILTASVDRALRSFKWTGRRPRYAERLILLMYFWSAWQNKCLSWACERLHYNTLFRPRQLPSISQFTRRVRTERFQRLLQMVHDDLRGQAPCLALSFIDAMPATVGPVSKDPDAKRGHVTGGFAKGYKLHAIVNENGRIVIWSVCPLNVDEKVVAGRLLAEAHPAGLGELSLGDSNYDSAPLHKTLAEHARHTGCDHALLTPLRGEQFVGPQGRTEKTLRAMGPGRRGVVNLWEHNGSLAKFVLEERNQIEGVFSVLSVVFGLGRLPAFVRRLERVTRWIGAKITLYHARLLAQESLAKTRVA